MRVGVSSFLYDFPRNFKCQSTIQTFRYANTRFVVENTIGTHCHCRPNLITNKSLTPNTHTMNKTPINREHARMDNANRPKHPSI